MDGANPDSWRIDEQVWECLSDRQLVPSQAATDFFRAATAVYCADLRIQRSAGFDRWSREIELNLPVHDLQTWQGAKSDLSELLTFLTGDRWTLQFRQQSVPPSVGESK